jgi:hypothetical protein
MMCRDPSLALPAPMNQVIQSHLQCTHRKRPKESRKAGNATHESHLANLTGSQWFVQARHRTNRLRFPAEIWLKRTRSAISIEL